MKASVENKMASGFVAAAALPDREWFSNQTAKQSAVEEDWVFHADNSVATLAELTILTSAEATQRGHFSHRSQFSGHTNFKQAPAARVALSRERDLVRNHQSGVNVYNVKPLDFQKFAASVRQTGFFRAIVSESPPGAMKRSG
jgi:hypothetical protein